MLLVVSSCVDEDLRRYVNSDGLVQVDLEASFSPFSEGDLTRASNVMPARGFNSISDIAILVFDKDGILLPDYVKELINPTTIDVEREDKDAAYNNSAESDTKRVADIPLLIPVGSYYIIAIANFGEYESNEAGAISIKKDENGKSITSLTKILQEINVRENFTLDDLRSLKVGWDANDFANDRAMLGFFASSDSKPFAGSKFETITISASGQKPRAWLRRCASKITVDFDGSGLRDNVSIFIKDVRIYDLAKDCTLGFGNPISDEENAVDFNNHPSSTDALTQRPTDPDAANGQSIEFGVGNTYDDWPRISRQTPYIMEDDGKTRKNLHAQDSECLYFYENMQGTREGYDRSPKPNLAEGGLQEGYNKKDCMPYGTYVEVTAHHIVEENGESVSHDIKYRFMIGKNAIDNFDAERNHHYKLTLAFNGTADEYHWHIDYTREEGFKVPNPWYVSYSYNQDAYLPFEFNLSDDWEVQDMVAEIITNPWYPTSNGDNAEGIDADFTDPDFEITPTIPDGDEAYPYVGNPENHNNCNGFLSLRAPSDESVLTDQRVGFTFTDYNSPEMLDRSADYYYGRNAGTDSNGNPIAPLNLGKRTIIENAAASTDLYNDREAISVKRETGFYSLKIPLFTREKALVKQSGYSGSNPFVGFQRVAKVKLTAKVRKKDNHEETKDFEALVNVVQVRRVVNPVGVYRKSGNNESFHVNLKYLTSERADGQFEPIISRGPWMAEVLGDNNFITLDGNQRVSGSSRSEIDFTIKFNRMGGTGNKNAIVRIKYHNYTCTHLIFIRQGYDPQAICPGGPVYKNANAPATVWDTFNMVAGDVMADDPRDEGSLFKFGNPYNCISSINNIYYDADGKPIYYEQSRSGFEPQETLVLLNDKGEVRTDNKTWGVIGKFDDGFSRWTDPLKIKQTATMRDFEQLYLTKHIEFGYGVLYADGATETQSSLEMVNGWYRDDLSSDKNKKGMRGVFAYYFKPNDNSGLNTKNIFFPIGRSGYGHRKNNKEDVVGTERVGYNGKGILRYSVNRPVPALDVGIGAFQRYAPLFEFLYRRMGAIYWSRTKTAEQAFYAWNGKPEEGQACGLDLNYFSFDVNVITMAGGVLDNGNDACFVRTVHKSAGDLN